MLLQLLQGNHAAQGQSQGHDPSNAAPLGDMQNAVTSQAEMVNPMQQAEAMGKQIGDLKGKVNSSQGQDKGNVAQDNAQTYE